MLFGYAFDDEPVQVIDLTSGAELPRELQNALYDPRILKTAFNAQFERTCLGAFLDSVQPPDQWQCTSVTARLLGLSGSLESVGEVVGLPEEKQKLKTGKALIRYFSIPCKPTKVNGQRSRNLPAHDPDKWKLFVEYCGQDVEAEREIRRKLAKFQILESEQFLWELDQIINDRGVGVDIEFARNAIEMDEIIKTRLLTQAQELTGLDNPKSVYQLKSWIEDVSGMIGKDESLTICQVTTGSPFDPGRAPARPALRRSPRFGF
jgi:DNA polymerase